MTMNICSLSLGGSFPSFGIGLPLKTEHKAPGEAALEKTS